MVVHRVLAVGTGSTVAVTKAVLLRLDDADAVRVQLPEGQQQVCVGWTRENAARAVWGQVPTPGYLSISEVSGPSCVLCGFACCQQFKPN